MCSDFEKVAMLKGMTAENDEDILLTYLNIAADIVLQRAYPFRSDIKTVPAKYATAQVDIACYLLNKRGAEGETAHNENGINRTYESADIPESLLRRITPFVGVV